MKNKKIRPEDEWLKWLSYEPELTKLVKEALNSKEVSQLSLAELDLVRSFRVQERMLELFKEYNTGAFTKDTLKEIKIFMKEESLEDLMINKLTEEELEDAKEILRDYEECPSEYWKEEFEDNQELYTYRTISMVDAYILHEALKIDNDRNSKAIKEKNMARIRKINKES